QVFELVTGDSLFHPKAGESMSLEEDHIGQIVELLGRIPPDVLQSGKHSAEYFDRRGNLRRVGPVKPWRLYDVLVEKYNFLLEEASEFSNFLLHMLDYHTERRATAAQCLQHPWLTSS
uniref:non-specific serine/threonine protein kinase n=1 Tax=Poecilia reticulata TaxID=8081 RepID=A0A3P9N043_POERE